MIAIIIISLLALIVILYGVWFSCRRLVLTFLGKQKIPKQTDSSEKPSLKVQPLSSKQKKVLIISVLVFSILLPYNLSIFLSSASNKDVNNDQKIGGTILSDTNKISVSQNELDSLQKIKDDLKEDLRVLRMKHLFHGKDVLVGRSIKLREGQSIRDRVERGSPYKLFYLIDISVYKISSSSALFLIKDSLFRKSDTLNVRLGETIKEDSNYVLKIKLNKININEKYVVFEPSIEGRY